MKTLIKKIIKREEKKGTIDLSFINDREMRVLNRKFRRKDRPTDVLSFSYDEGKTLGDVIISRETARRNAKKYGVAYRDEVRRLVIHGTLHVLGYNHGRMMKDAETSYAQL
ncbi:MAG: rRNA maturation RNase YbeY [Candidatus Saganbacteria bacterium]|nr:rRNA maturation RNase YbeY [Candidatus Saganbacteria bacterium]